MISALNIGTTGLNTFERALDAQSNNMSNSSTLAHKVDEVSFEDLIYQSRYGKGVNIQSVEKNFTQGDIQITNNSLDVAIEGDGFFVVYDSKNEETYYTRAGNFKMGVDGTLQTAYGDDIFGSTISLSTVSSDDNQTFNTSYTEFIATEPIAGLTFNQTINAKATDYTKTAVDTGTSGQGFKTSSALINDIRELSKNYNEKLDLYASNPVNPGTSSSTQSYQINFPDFDTKITEGYVEVYINDEKFRQSFDTDPQTTMNLFADKISNIPGLTAEIDANGILTIDSLVPGKDNRITGAAINSYGYDAVELVAPVEGEGYGMVTSARDALKTAIEAAGGKFLEMTNTVNVADSQLNGIGTIQLKLDNLGISENTFGQLSIEDGLVFATDQETKFLLGRLETVTFQNPESLEPQGQTYYSLGKDTGNAYNASNLNTITGGSVELSNSNYSESLIDLMVYQRAFEANSKSVTTADEFLRTAIELKK